MEYCAPTGPWASIRDDLILLGTPVQQPISLLSETDRWTLSLRKLRGSHSWLRAPKGDHTPILRLYLAPGEPLLSFSRAWCRVLCVSKVGCGLLRCTGEGDIVGAGPEADGVVHHAPSSCRRAAGYANDVWLFFLILKASGHDTHAHATAPCFQRVGTLAQEFSTRASKADGNEVGRCLTPRTGPAAPRELLQAPSVNLFPG